MRFPQLIQALKGADSTRCSGKACRRKLKTSPESQRNPGGKQSRRLGTNRLRAASTKCQRRPTATGVWRHQEIGPENCRPGAGRRTGGSLTQRVLDAAKGRIRGSLAVSTAFRASAMVA